MLKTAFRFLAYLFVIGWGARGSSLIATIWWPDLKEQHPWLWLLSGAVGAAAMVFVASKIFPPRHPRVTPKTDPVIPEAPADPKTYEEWRKDLDRTVDETAPDFLPLEDFIKKWSDVPRTPKKEPLVPSLEVAAERIKAVVGSLNVAVGAPAPIHNVASVPDNIIKYSKGEVDRNVEAGRTVIDPFTGSDLAGAVIRVTEDGSCFHRGASGPVLFYSDTERITIDSIDYAVPQGGSLVVHLPAGAHFVRAKRLWPPVEPVVYQRPINYGGP